jgi:hypothetical protein
LLCHLGLALTVALAGAGPSAAQSPAPAITVETAPAAGEADTGKAPAVKPAATAPAATKKKGEVLPWADKPLTPVAAATGGDPAAAEAAASCGGLFEAACRDLKACAWIADVALENGTTVPARCVARPPAPPKSAKKTSHPQKKTAKAPAAPAVKASQTRAEGETPAAAAPEAAKIEPATALAEPEAPAPVHEEAARAEAPHEKAAGKPEEHAENAETPVEAKAPIVVKPPPQPEDSGLPSFSAVTPMIPGGDAIVVTVPPSGE